MHLNIKLAQFASGTTDELITHDDQTVSAEETFDKVKREVSESFLKCMQ